MTTTHIIAETYFPPLTAGIPGWLTCSCEVTLTVWPDPKLSDIWELMDKAWLAHRRSPGTRPIDAPVGGGWQSEFRTAIGTSRLSAAERGRMGAEAKRRKAGVAS